MAEISQVFQSPTVSPEERDLAIRTIAGEAGGEPDMGQAGVAAVLRNRLNSGAYGKNLQSVIMAPAQFSLWNKGDPAGDLARGLDPNSPQYQKIGSAFDGVMSGQIPDPTNGATHYYNPHAAAPAWGPQLAQQNDVTIGNHRFVGTGEAGPGNAMATSIPAPAQVASSALPAPYSAQDSKGAPAQPPSSSAAQPAQSQPPPAQGDTVNLASLFAGLAKAANPPAAPAAPPQPTMPLPGLLNGSPDPRAIAAALTAQLPGNLILA